ncbi:MULTISPECIES: SRPBCC family protein [unclassified Nocardioides]|uniref:SRPBCC family protein n=1 Tax=unclassified Nocardioides TaxID=2615069 RepID=UPI0006FF32DC|nr:MULTISPECIES: SRPBCC family protein [unclassified Nocardioides]KRA38658.1 hypothetical protein ASD81_08620 [Nocardioides sp. Root614]KRA92618.1 hypothetical protein ASD84_08885 [Nocardioides sp. Root682]
MPAGRRAGRAAPGRRGLQPRRDPLTRLEITFPVPPDRAFAYLADPRNRPEWQSSLRAVADLSAATEGAPTAAGVTWTDVTVVPGVRPRMRTVQSEAPLLWVEEGRCGPARARLALAFSPCPGGTRVVAEFDVHALGLGWLVTVLSRPAIGADLRRAARVLAAAR